MYDMKYDSDYKTEEYVNHFLWNNIWKDRNYDLKVIYVKMYLNIEKKSIMILFTFVCVTKCGVRNRGKMLLGYSDAELANMGGYDLVHFDDLAYVASAHQECKFGFSIYYIYK